MNMTTAPKFQNKYRIPSARATWHNYDGGMYFVTICTKEKIHYFGEIVDGEMRLKELGKYASECMENVSLHFPDAEIPLFVVMPNHIHSIVYIDRYREFISHSRNATHNRDAAHSRDAACHVSTINDCPKNKKMQEIANQCGRLSVVVGGIKSAITKFANQHQIPFAWQTRFHDRIIRDQNECNAIADYIENNAMNWHLDELNIL